MVVGQLGVGQRDRGDRRVPDRRDAGLDPDRAVLLDQQVVELPHAPTAPGPSRGRSPGTSAR